MKWRLLGKLSSNKEMNKQRIKHHKWSRRPSPLHPSAKSNSLSFQKWYPGSEIVPKQTLRWEFKHRQTYKSHVHPASNIKSPKSICLLCFPFVNCQLDLGGLDFPSDVFSVYSSYHTCWWFQNGQEIDSRLLKLPTSQRQFDWFQLLNCKQALKLFNNVVRYVWCFWLYWF